MRSKLQLICLMHLRQDLQPTPRYVYIHSPRGILNTTSMHKACMIWYRPVHIAFCIYIKPELYIHRSGGILKSWNGQKTRSFCFSHDTSRFSPISDIHWARHSKSKETIRYKSKETIISNPCKSKETICYKNKTNISNPGKSKETIRYRRIINLNLTRVPSYLFAQPSAAQDHLTL